MNLSNPKIVFFGAGVIGGSVGAWIAPHYDNLYFLDRGKVAEALKAGGISTYPEKEPSKIENVKVKVIDDLSDAPDADVIVLAVKNYSLEKVANIIKDKMGDKPVILSMANGIANQRILPKYFSKIVYCVISYNGWMDELVKIGYQSKGPLHIGTLDGSLEEEMYEIARIFNMGVETDVESRINDAIHCKIVLNLNNSATTLLGKDFKTTSDRALLQKLLGGTTYEGIRIIKAAGHREVKLGGMPSWLLISASTKLPRLLTKGLFDKNVKKMVMSSMAQDVIVQGSGETELETINGYIIELADKVGHPAPFNRTIYELCKREFAKDEFTPMPIEDVWARIQKNL